jgi:hypothetical protein
MLIPRLVGVVPCVTGPTRAGFPELELPEA